MMKRGSSLFLILLFVACPLIWLDHVITHNPSRFVNQKIPWVLQHEKDSFDYVVSGSSRAENMVSIDVIDSIRGSKGLNIGYSGSGIQEMYLTAYLFLKKNSIHFLFLEMDPFVLLDPVKNTTYPFHEYYFFPYIEDSTTKAALRKSTSALHFLCWNYLPYFKYAEYNSFYPVTNYFYLPDVFDFNSNHGTVLLTEYHESGFPSRITYPTREAPVFNESVAYLNALAELCSQKKVKLVLFTAPVYRPFYDSVNKSEYQDAIQTFSQKFQIQVMDFTQDALCDSSSFFFNERHLNAQGTARFSTLLADSLKVYLKK